MRAQHGVERPLSRDRFRGGKIPAIPLNLALLKGCSLVGVFWGTHTRREPEVHAANVKALFKLFDEGRIRPHVTEMNGLERFTDALDVLNSRRATGKVVIRVTPGTNGDARQGQVTDGPRAILIRVLQRHEHTSRMKSVRDRSHRAAPCSVRVIVQVRLR